jgi:serine/threonine protein kinase
MAFTEPIHHDLAGVLSGGFYDRPDRSETNLLRRSTEGIRLLYSEISASRSFGGMVVRDPSTTTDREGRLITGNSNPTLAKRYRLLEAIGTGSFSQIFRALDTYAEKHVAVKVLHAGLASLGDRETRALRYFRSKEVRGAKHCK